MSRRSRRRRARFLRLKSCGDRMRRGRFVGVDEGDSVGGGEGEDMTEVGMLVGESMTGTATSEDTGSEKTDQGIMIEGAMAGRITTDHGTATAGTSMTTDQGIPTARGKIANPNDEGSVLMVGMKDATAIGGTTGGEGMMTATTVTGTVIGGIMTRGIVTGMTVIGDTEGMEAKNDVIEAIRGTNPIETTRTSEILGISVKTLTTDN
jgi:hypothetical protein